VINGSLIGYEIKSDSDTLSRLRAQIAVYRSVLDYVTAVAGGKHLSEVERVVPPTWGLVRASAAGGAVQLEVMREPTLNGDVDALALTQMLWRDELVAELKARELYRGLSAQPKGALWRRLGAEVPIQELRHVVRTRVKARGDWRAAPPQW
jgi:hypothetical protein